MTYFSEFCRTATEFLELAEAIEFEEFNQPMGIKVLGTYRVYRGSKGLGPRVFEV